MSISEITLEELNAEEFIKKQVAALSSAVGDEIAINALSGGVDSSVVTLLGHRAFGDRLKTYFIENGLMREGEPQQIVAWFADLGVKVEIVDARDKFFAGLKGITDPEDISHRVSEHASLRSEDVADAVVFMLSRPPHVTIRDLVMLPQSQDL